MRLKLDGTNKFSGYDSEISIDGFIDDEVGINIVIIIDYFQKTTNKKNHHLWLTDYEQINALKMYLEMMLSNHEYKMKNITTIGSQNVLDKHNIDD